MSNSPLKVSIITIAYNSAGTISDTINSVISQDYANIEYIIVDGNSKDNTIEIVKGYNGKVSKLVSEPDKGIYDAMNKGVALATGDVIGILNSDDYYADNSVISDVAAKFADPEVEAVYSDLVFITKDSYAGTERKFRTWRSGKYSRSSFLYGWMPPHPTFFVRAEAYKRCGNYNIILKSAADYELMLRMLFKYRLKAIYLKRITVKMRIGGVSNASFKNRLKANMEDRKAWKLNELRPYFFTLYLKPIRKIVQFFLH